MRNRLSGKKSGFIAWVTAMVVTALPAVATTVVPKSVRDCVHDADAIIVGHVLKSVPRWGTPTHEWIYTDITFQIDEVLQPNATVQAHKDVTLTYWGGTLGGQTMMASDMVHPRVGEHWVLMLKPNLAVQTLTPVVGVQQGMLRVDRDNLSGHDLVDEAEGDPLFVAANGSVLRNFERKQGDGSRAEVTLAQFESWIHTNLAHIKATPVKRLPAVDPNDPRVMRTFSKQPKAAGENIEQAHTATMPQSPFDRAAGPTVPTKPIIQEVTPVSTTGDGLSELLTGIRDDGGIRPNDWSNYEIANVPIVVNNFPHDWYWSPEDQYALSRWNYYSNIYQVYTNPTGTFAGNDGVFDLDGWPDDGTISSVYGQHWDTAGGELAVTFYYLNSSGTIVDADIAFNPAWSWTLDDNWIFSGTSAQPFRATMQHESGHMFGLKHDFNDLSIMNYAPSVYRALAVPYMDDAEAIRSLYPAQAQDVTDLGVYLWESIGYQDWGDPSFPGSVVAGDSIFINNYHMENVGMETIWNPTLEWYLTTSLNYSDPYYYLATISYNTPLGRYTQYNDSSVGVYLSIPAGVPGGTYYMNAYIRNDGGGLNFPFNNNEGWSHSQITVYPLVTGLSVSPDPVDGGVTTIGTVSLGSAAGPGGLWIYVSSTDPSVPDPGWVNVPQGATTTTFWITTYAPTAPTLVTLTASSYSHSASTSLYLTVPTAMQMSNVSGLIGTTVDLNATLTRTSDNAGVAGETLYYYVDGGYVGYEITDGTGSGSLPYTLTDILGAGTHTLEVDFDGDYYDYDSSYVTSTLTVGQAKTSLAVTNAIGASGQAVTLKATLKRLTDRAGVTGVTVNFSVAGSSVGSGTTDGSGVATFSYTIPSDTAAGSETINAQFTGNTNYAAGAGKGVLTVKAPVAAATKVTVSNASGSRGKNVNLLATLKTISNVVIPNATLQYSVAGLVVGTATTNAAGQAALTYTIPQSMATGAKKIQVMFAATAAYKASSGTGTLAVH